MSKKLTSYLGKRLLQLAIVVLAVASVNFLLVHIAPGDVASILAGQSGTASPEYVAQIRHEFGLDRPLYIQYASYVWEMLRLNFGTSYTQQTSVLSLISDRLPATIILMVSAIVVAIVFGVILGVISARRRGSFIDNVISVVALVVYATPIFWLGLMLIIVFSVIFNILPSGGMITVGHSETGINYLLDLGRHLILPALTLALFYMAIYARLMRASMIDVLSSDFITTARAKGLKERTIAWRHAVPNAILPVVTFAGVMFGNMFGGSILIETVFGWPGLGRLLFSSLLSRDFPVLLGILFISSIMVVVANLIVDLVYMVIDPRTGR